MKDENSEYKIGLTEDVSEREKDYSNYNKSGQFVHMRYCINSKLSEDLLHHVLDKYRTLANREWFRFPSQEFAIMAINNIIHIMDCGGDLKNVDSFIPDLNSKLNITFRESDGPKPEQSFEELSNDNYNAPTLVEKTEKKIEEPYRPASIIKREHSAQPLNQLTGALENKKCSESVQYSISSEDTKEEDTLESENYVDTQAPQDNPKDFGKFVQEFCEVGDDFMDSKSRLRDAYCIWSKTDNIDNKKELENYLKEHFRSGVGIFPGESARKTVFRGLRTKPLTFCPSSKNLDYEKFVLEECKVDYECRISFTEFYNYFIEWKRKSEATYMITLKMKQDLKSFLLSNFLAGRIIDNLEDSKKFSRGVFGIGHGKNGYGIHEPIRHKNRVDVFDSKTGEKLQSFESCILASQAFGIPHWTLGRYIRTEEIIDGKLFKYC